MGLRFEPILWRIHRPRNTLEPLSIQTLGLAQISETWKDGAHIGYRITCRRHKNAEDAEHTECKKDIAMAKGTTHTPLEKTECVRRLKRWLIGGANHANESQWPEGEQRSYHVGQELATECRDSPLP